MPQYSPVDLTLLAIGDHPPLAGHPAYVRCSEWSRYGNV